MQSPNRAGKDCQSPSCDLPLEMSSDSYLLSSTGSVNNGVYGLRFRVHAKEDLRITTITTSFRYDCTFRVWAKKDDGISVVLANGSDSGNQAQVDIELESPLVLTKDEGYVRAWI